MTEEKRETGVDPDAGGDVALRLDEMERELAFGAGALVGSVVYWPGSERDDEWIEAMMVVMVRGFGAALANRRVLLEKERKEKRDADTMGEG